MTEEEFMGIKINNISKIYGLNTSHPFAALDNISLEIKKGEALALLGHNGAGKTTLIKILTTLLEPTFGQATIDGLSIAHDQALIKHIVGYTTQDLSLDPNLTVSKVLSLQSMYYGILNNQKRIDRLLEITGLEDERKTIVRYLSGGMKRRLMIAKALVHDPKIVILDEPTVGIDITLKERILQAIETLREEGRTIILTTHSFDEVERLCHSVTILQNGRKTYSNTIDAIKKDIPQNMLIVHSIINGDKKGYEEEANKMKQNRAIINCFREPVSGNEIIQITNAKEEISIAMNLLSRHEGHIIKIEQPQISVAETIGELMKQHLKNEARI